MKEKPTIAIIIPGGIGTGRNNIGVPVLERIVKLLSADFNLTVFQLYKINEGYVANDFDLIETYSTNRMLKNLTFFFVFWKMYRLRRFSVVHGFWAHPSGFLAVLVGKLFRIKSIVSVLGGDAIALPEIKYGQLQGILSRKLIFWTLREANEVVLLTKYLENNLNAYGFLRKGIKIIPWGIDTNLFHYRQKQMDNVIEFLHIGNLYPVKDQETLLRAFKIISESIPAHLTIVGEGICEDSLKVLMVQMNLLQSVTLRGQLPYEQLPSLYHKSDILLHTSLSEGQCEVVTEAMSCGVLVCGTKVGLMYDLPTCCVAVPIRDYEGLAMHVVELLNDSSRINEIRSNALEWSKAHSINWTVKEIKKMYQEI